MSMIIHKLGSMHLAENIPNQDYFLLNDSFKMVLDGCSADEEGNWLTSEVGVRLFAQLFDRLPEEIKSSPDRLEEGVRMVFEKMMALAEDVLFLAQNFCFTIVVVYELEDRFLVKYCGDGYIITRKKEGDEIEFISLEEECIQGCPKYYLYHYIPTELYLDDVSFQEKEFLKEEYENVGVATDGIRFFLDAGPLVQKKLEENLRQNKAGRIRVQIATMRDHMKDDITICY